MKKKVISLVRILITVAFLLYVSTHIEFKQIYQSVLQADIKWLFLSFLTLVITRLLMSFRWKIILHAYNFNTSIINILKIFFLSMPAGYVTPGGAGQDLVRGYYVSKEHGNTVDVAGTILLDRILGLYSMILVSLFAILLLPYFNNINYIKSILILLSIGLPILFILFFLLVNKTNVLNKITPSKKINKIIKKLSASVSNISILKKIIFKILTISIVVQLFRCMMFYFIYVSLGVRINLLYFIAFIPIIFLLMTLPISINGLGLREVSLMHLFSQFGVNGEISVTAGLLSYLFQLLMLIPGLLIFLLQKQQDKKDNYGQ